jgi:hypothetical protein
VRGASSDLLTAPGSEVAVFICSSDSRIDILERVLPSIFKFWPKCPYPIYAGLNTHSEKRLGITTIVAPPSEWRRECLEQVSQLRATHLILLLDDFLLHAPVNESRLSVLVSQAIISDFSYLRLLPLGKSLPQRLIPSPRAQIGLGIQALEDHRPFYSGLQIAIWKKAHFASLLEVKGSIWDFEHHRLPGVRHHAIMDNPPILYRHLVEKGRWFPYAKTQLRRVGLATDLGTRPIWSKWMNILLLLDELRFFLLGYTIRLGR